MRKPATLSAQGGARGGGSVLTPEGQTLVQLYRDMERRAERACADQIARLLRMVAKA